MTLALNAVFRYSSLLSTEEIDAIMKFRVQHDALHIGMVIEVFFLIPRILEHFFPNPEIMENSQHFQLLYSIIYLSVKF